MKTKSKNVEFAAFSALLGRISTVSHREVKEKLEEEKRQKKRAPRRSLPSGRVSGDKD
jgi:hypothetical protein